MFEKYVLQWCADIGEAHILHDVNVFYTKEELEECIENLKAEYQDDLEYEVKKHIDTDELYKQAIELWGKNDQIGLAIEECSELITKLAKFGRNVNGSTEKDILEEMVDVQIMLSQLKKIFSNPVKWEELYQQKLKRLKEYIESGLGDV